MFISEYSHDKSYFNFEIPGVLPDEGILKGKEGELRFRRVHDGLAVYDTTLLNSGFVYPGSIDDVYVPHTINAIPITELHQTIRLKSRNAFSIENGNLKRVFISIGKQSLNEQIEHSENGLGALLLYMLREKENANQNEDSIEIEFSFCGNSNPQVEFCSIKCDDPVVLHMPAAKKVEVMARKNRVTRLCSGLR